MLESGQGLDAAKVERTIDMVREDLPPVRGPHRRGRPRRPRGRTVRPNTAGQKRYTDAIASNTITFGIGPAGTGKSYLAVALAVQALQAPPGQPDHPDPARPSRPASGSASCPGDLMAKVDPYLRPLYDALYDLLEPEGAQRLLDRGTVEVAPLAFMRGRTLNNSFIILDEAQNTTPEQMKMFLTRIGFGSQVRRHRRRHPDRRRRGPLGAGRPRGGARRRSTASPSSISPGATSSATGSWPTSSTPTSAARPPRTPA